MEQRKFGDILRQAREQSGEDVATVARRIRIRPDILVAIEASNLAEMPPRGYSRNMINAYARYLGLNATDIVGMYLDAQYQYQLQSARENLQPSGIDIPSTRRSAARQTIQGSDRVQDLSGLDASPSQNGPYGSGVGSQGSRRGQVSTRPASVRPRSAALSGSIPPANYQTSPRGTVTSRPGASPHGGSALGSSASSSYGTASYSASRLGRSMSRETVEFDRSLDAIALPGSAGSTRRRQNVEVEHVGSFNAAGQGLRERSTANVRFDDFEFTDPVSQGMTGIDTDLVRRASRAGSRSSGGASGALASKLPLIIGAVVVLAVIVALVMGISSLVKSKSDTPSTPINVTGVSGSAADSQDQAAPEPPTRTVVTYTVTSEDPVYIETSLDGADPVGKDVEPGTVTSVEVTGTFEIAVTPADGVVLTQDGVTVELTDNGDGVGRASIDFADVLSEWRVMHPDAAMNASGTDSSFGDSSSGSDGNSGSDAGGQDGSDSGSSDTGDAAA